PRGRWCRCRHVRAPFAGVTPGTNPSRKAASGIPTGYPRCHTAQMSALQRMKPITAAKRLGIYLPAAPEEFQAAWLTREELAALESDPPEWLRVLRRQGPHPRPVVAGRRGVSSAGPARAGADEAGTTAESEAPRAAPPAGVPEEGRGGAPGRGAGGRGGG